MTLSEQGQLACRILAGMPHKRRTYQGWVDALAVKLRPPEGLSRRANAVQVAMEVMISGVVSQVGERLLTDDQLREEMGGGPTS